MSNVCSLGPYNQTLFLGCSISNYNCNLGWGADQSTLSVNLVKDSCSHPQSTMHDAGIDIPIDTILSQSNNIPSRALHGIGNSPPIFDPLGDQSKSLYRNIAQNIKQSEEDRENQNIRLPSDLADFGKKALGVYSVPKFWTSPDPGFLTLPSIFSRFGLDIMGIPVVFRFNNFSFGGMVSSWKQNGGSSAVQTFDVEIKSFSSLLNNCQLIIDKYAGTMCGLVGNGLAVPAPYSTDFSGNIPAFQFFDHRANINQGNIPNVFNIYGYLEYLGYKNRIFGGAGVNDNGMRAQFIYDALVSMLGTPANINNIEMNRFAPYGGILTRTIRSNRGEEINPSTTLSTINLIPGVVLSNEIDLSLTDMGICPNIVAHDGYRRSRLMLDITEVPRPPRWLRMAGPSISIMQFISEVCDGAGFDFFVDFLAPPFGANYSGIIKIRTVSRRNQSRKQQIDALITNAANRIGVSSYSKGQEYADTPVRSMYVGGNQKRLLQFKNIRLAYKQNSLIYNPWIDRWINYGMPSNFLPSLPNQVRLPNFLSTRRYSVRDLGGGAAVWSDSNNFNRTTYFTSSNSSRIIKQGNYIEAGNLSSNSMFQEVSSGGLGQSDIDPVNILGQDLGDINGTNNIPLYADTICPFFGVGYGGLIRKVFFDVKMGQMQILFFLGDIASLTTLPLGSYDTDPDVNPFTGFPQMFSTSNPVSFLVLENEIRAAGAGFASWLQYCFGNVFKTDISQLIYKAYKNKYGAILDNVRGDFLSSANSIIAKAQNKNLIVNGRQMQVSLEDLNPRTKSLYHDLEKIHAFFYDIANKYYAKQYMVRAPNFAYYNDLSYAYNNNNQRILLGTDEDNNPIYAIEGNGKIYANYSPSPDGAWEEPGNWIDDAMVVGGVKSNWFADDSGKIPSIIGFNASSERDHRTIFNNLRDVDIFDVLYERLLFRNPFGNNYYRSINHQLSADDYILVSYPGSTQPWVDSYGDDVPTNQRQKLYTRANVAQSLEFLEPFQNGPRIIVSLSSAVYIGQKQNTTDYDLEAVMTQDALAFLKQGLSLPSTITQTNEPFGNISNLLISRLRTGVGGFAPAAVLGNIPADYDGMFFNLAFRHQNAIGDGRASPDEPSIIGKAAVPIFCAVPIEYHTMVYGPWINHPGLIRNNIFPDSYNPILDVENLIGGVKVNIDPGLVPWDFGGMTQLDDAVMLKIAEDVNYQQYIESGTVTMPGLDNLSLGAIIRYFGSLFDGPIVNSIQVQIGEGGLTTTYNFRTYTRKLGLFNKENAERIKAIGQEAIKRNKEISSKIMNLASRLIIRTF